jgi:alkanesulfonate monooxygenase SsuD/methylene tetrahydromethanopterin reductase-like flavin-dependent oxidoreductase (luciferase family)
MRAGGPSPGDDGVAVLEVAREAEQAGVGTLWLPGAQLGGIDAGPLAGAVAAATSAIGVGVMDRPSHGRHPSALAREVTALDRLSGGRAAVAVLEHSGSTEDVERLVEAAGLLHRLFTEHGVTVAGRFYEVAELTIRPRPLRPDGPAVLAGRTGPPPPRGANAEAVVDAGASAFVTGGAPAAVEVSRRQLADSGSPAPVVWRGELAEDPGHAVAILSSAFEHGADGVIVALPARAAVGAALDRRAVELAVAVLGWAARGIDQ